MTLSLLKLSIDCLRFLLIAIASLNFWFALSNLFSNILIYARINLNNILNNLFIQGMLRLLPSIYTT